MRGSAGNSASIGGRQAMRLIRLIPALALAIAACSIVSAQTTPQKTPAAPPAKPYKTIAITLPATLSDPSFDIMRLHLADAAERKDRAALARLVVRQGFFWDRENGDGADKHKSGLDNLAAALGLNNNQGVGWDLLATYANDPGAAPSPEHKGAYCSPGDPAYSAKEFDDLVDATDTDPGDWGYPTSPGIEVRADGAPGAPVIDKLGLYFVRVLPDTIAAAPSFIHIAMPSGKTGYVSIDSIAPMGNDQLCFVKEGSAWKVGGYTGGGEPQ
jgi:hypothetical protein